MIYEKKNLINKHSYKKNLLSVITDLINLKDNIE